MLPNATLFLVGASPTSAVPCATAAPTYIPNECANSPNVQLPQFDWYSLSICVGVILLIVFICLIVRGWWTVLITVDFAALLSRGRELAPVWLVAGMQYHVGIFAWATFPGFRATAGRYWQMLAAPTERENELVPFHRNVPDDLERGLPAVPPSFHSSLASDDSHPPRSDSFERDIVDELMPSPEPGVTLVAHHSFTSPASAHGSEDSVVGSSTAVRSVVALPGAPMRRSTTGSTLPDSVIKPTDTPTRRSTLPHTEFRGVEQSMAIQIAAS